MIQCKVGWQFLIPAEFVTFSLYIFVLAFMIWNAYKQCVLYTVYSRSLHPCWLSRVIQIAIMKWLRYQKWHISLKLSTNKSCSSFYPLFNGRKVCENNFSPKKSVYPNMPRYVLYLLFIHMVPSLKAVRYYYPAQVLGFNIHHPHINPNSFTLTPTHHDGHKSFSKQ